MVKKVVDTIDGRRRPSRELFLFGLLLGVGVLCLSYYARGWYHQWARSQDDLIALAVYRVGERSSFGNYEATLFQRRQSLQALGPGVLLRVRCALNRTVSQPRPWIGRRLFVTHFGGSDWRRPPDERPWLSRKSAVLAAEALGPKAASLIPDLSRLARFEVENLGADIVFAMARIAPDSPQSQQVVSALRQSAYSETSDAATLAWWLMVPSDRDRLAAVEQAVLSAKDLGRWVRELAPRVGGIAHALVPAFRRRFEAEPWERASIVLLGGIDGLFADEDYMLGRIESLHIALRRAGSESSSVRYRKLVERANLMRLFLSESFTPRCQAAWDRLWESVSENQNRGV